MAQIGKNIREIRERRGMTQDDLAGKLYVSRQTISNYEVGRSKPDIETLTRLAEILGTDLTVLIYGAKDPEERRIRIRRFWIAAIGCGVWLLCSYFLEKWITTWQGVHYQSWPGLVMELLYKPVLFAALGWVATDGLMAYGKLRSIPKSWTKKTRGVLLGLAAVYLISSGIYILLCVSGRTPPVWWGRMVYGILRTMPLTGLRICHVLAGICGALVRLAGSIPAQTNTDAERKTDRNPDAL